MEKPVLLIDPSIWYWRRRVSMPDACFRQAARCYEFAGQTCDVLQKILEQRDALFRTNTQVSS